MTKDEINSALRDYARSNLTPRQNERDLVTNLYASIKAALGEGNCLQIGSFPRFTAITPVHDLDVLHIIGAWQGAVSPFEVLDDLKDLLTDNFENPTDFTISISLQAHSVTISFTDDGEDVFSIDVVPAFSTGQNEFGDPMYVVPETAKHPRRERRYIPGGANKDDFGDPSSYWIRSDPRGYISAAQRLNDDNDDFRKAAKIVKRWKQNQKLNDDNFPLKSFHLEQIVTRILSANRGLSLFDIIFEFFRTIEDYVRDPRIPDRADPSIFIDQYIADLSHSERRKISHAKDYVLKSLEEIAPSTPIESIFSGELYERPVSEKFLFDLGIPVLTEENLRIRAEVLPRTGGFRGFLLDVIGRISVDRKISFRHREDVPGAQLYKWKVKNDDDCRDPRGEITDHSTRNDPENSKYIGEHYVECYAIRNNVCIARARQYVRLGGL
ncbi:hypothetical protein [Henriciella sp.]|uniref:nucleotide-binding domain-containing protein n=1 Tax=Henriciella sp. TaxID=1968823 RepID=UPI00261E3E32|nr:hypothetical protein [Henriciella sp.]